MSEADNYIAIQVLRIEQNVGAFYVGVMKARDLYEIAEVDRIRLQDLEIPKYLGFQRALIPERVAQIRSYLTTPRSTFPNAIILSLDSEYVEEWKPLPDNENLSLIRLRNEKGAATIIDGQHRTAALDSAPDQFQVIVAIFLDLEMVQQAEIFAKINSTQRAVNPSIAFQLFGYAEERSPQRTAHEIAEMLNTKEGSPFYRKLQMLGTRDDWTAGVLSQSTFCKELMKLYTKDYVADEYSLLRKEALQHYEGYPLREFFIKGDDKKILQIVWKFFYSVAIAWPDQWNNPKSILTKTTGYSAFVQLLKIWLLGPRKDEVYQDRVSPAFNKIKADYSDGKRFSRDNYPAGNQGIQKLRNSLASDLDLLETDDK